MSTITLPNIRVSSDLTVSVRLKDNGVAIDWSTLNNVKASIYSDAQRALAGRCDVSVNAEDPTVLVCQYAANKPQYVGVCRIVVSAKYMGETKTYDKPAFNFVRWTADQDGEQITIDDPDVDVEIDVADVSSSLLDEAIRAAFTAAEEAVDAKGQVLETEAEVEAAEALRVSAEESRVEAEEGRAEAEAARVDEEAVRVSAEDARVVAENARAAAEDLREGAEDDRAAAETARETAEAARVAAEALRVTAEGSRETAEAAREAQASADHTVAAGDHTQAAADHTQAAADHTTAASDHTQAGADHTRAAADHVTAGEDHAQAQDDHEVMAGYDTRLGNVEGEVSQLEAKVDENTAQVYANVGDQVASANIVSNYTAISGLVVGKRYILVLTLSADATIDAATATDTSRANRVSPFIYTAESLTAGKHIKEWTYNGGGYLALHDSGLGYSVFSSFAIYASLKTEIDTINENRVQSISASSTEKQYPSAVCLYRQFEIVPTTANLLNPDTLTDGYISDSSGTITPHASFKTTDFIDVDGTEKIYFYKGTTMEVMSMSYFLAYDEDRQPISASYASSVSGDGATIQSTWKYVRFGFILANNTKPLLTSSPSTTYTPFVGNRITAGDNTSSRVNSIEKYLNNNVKTHVPGTQIPVTLNAGKIILPTGVVFDFSNQNYCVSDEVVVSENTAYIISGNANYGNLVYAFYDGDGGLLSSKASGSGASGTFVVSAPVVSPSGATKLRISCIKPADALLFIGEDSSFSRQFLPYMGKKWVCIGDSLTEYNQRTSVHYFDYVSQNTGIEIVNLGISGTGYAKGGSVNNFLTRVPSIPLDADVITIFGSFNDLSGTGKQLGNIDDGDDTTICGCINLVLDAIQERVPLVPLGIVSPTPWKNAGPNVAGDSGADNYVDALKRICAYRSIPFMDLYHCSNLHPTNGDFRVLAYSKDGTYTASTSSTPGAIEVTVDNIATIQAFGVPDAEVGDWVLPDLLGCHPNELGHKLIAGRFETLLKSIM